MASHEKAPEKDPLLKELSKKQRKFAKWAAKAMAKEFGVNREDFEVYVANESDRPVVEDPKPEDLNEEGLPKDGKPWVEATAEFVAEYAIHYAGEETLENFEIEGHDLENPVTIIDVGRKKKKGREGYATQVYAHVPENSETPVPTIRLPKDL